LSKKLTARVADSITNLVARLGWGGGNQFSASRYSFDFMSRNRTELEAGYRTSWLIGAAVDNPAEDMTQAGIKMNSKIDPQDEEVLQAAIRDLGLWGQLCSTLKWAGLFGGAGGFLMIDGQDPSTPLNIDTIGREKFKGILPMDRWMVIPTLTDLVMEYGPHFGKPAYYNVVTAAPGMPSFKIHHTRLLRFIGNELPYYQRQYDQYWGESVIERIHDRLIAYDSTSQGAAQLVYKAHLRTYTVDGLRDIIGEGGPLFDALIKQLNLIRSWQTNEGLTVIDGKDKFEAHQYTFAGLPDMLLQFGQQISGALQQPLVRLFGQSPAGLNSSGESDIRTYYDGIKKRQERDLRHPMTVLLDVLSMSKLGHRLPPGFGFDFVSLWQISEKEKADIANTGAQAIAGAFDVGLISQKTAMEELRGLSESTGYFGNITDKDIAAADALALAAGGEGPDGEKVPKGDEGGDDPQNDESQKGGGSA
jgi:phage-related protein (TIGR01555 family)